MDESEWVEQLDGVAVELLEASVRETGLVLPPTVHVFVDGLAVPYVGSLTCRPFYRGDDAARAMAVMGLLGSMLDASRLVVTWEHADLHVALRLPDAPTGLVVLDAPRAGGHVLRWHSLNLRPGPTMPGGPPIVTDWGPVMHYPDVDLPNPIDSLLHSWRSRRTWPDDERQQAFAAMQAAGYRMRWSPQRDGDSRPGWHALIKTGY